MIKKLLALLLFSLTFQFQGLAQGSPSIANFHITPDSCWNGIGASMISVNAYVTNSIPTHTVAFYWGDGTSTTASSPQGYFTAAHNYTLVGTYTVMAILLDGTTPLDTAIETFNTFCSAVYGMGYKRTDANCVFNSGTEAIVNTSFEIEVRKAGIPIDTIQSNGYVGSYIEQADLTSEFSLQVLNPPAGMINACPTGSYTFKFDTLDYSNGTFNFGFDCDPSFTGFDLYSSSFGLFRPVANSYLNIYPRNAACVPMTGDITLHLSPKYTMTASNIAPSSVSGNTITWSIANISNSTYPYINLTLAPVGTLTIGDTVANTIIINPIAGDIDPSNNTLVAIDSIRASFDPNEKHVYPMNEITQGEELTYTIHFENLGNDTAFNIHILDTLSAHLDAQTFKVITSSHPVAHHIFNTGAENILKFDFANIHLADASDPTNNKGFVTFKINAKSPLPLGTTIDNTASIYFDINPPIVTNTTQNIIPLPQSIPEPSPTKRVKVYPNPAADKLFIEHIGSFSEVLIVNAIGQQVIQQPINSNTEYINIDLLPSGMYFVKAIAKDGNYIQQFVKQ